MTHQEYKDRLGELRTYVLKRFPSLRTLLLSTEEFTLHQDAWPFLEEDEIYALGALIKVAGIYGTTVRIVGFCGERQFAKGGTNKTAGRKGDNI